WDFVCVWWAGGGGGGGGGGGDCKKKHDSMTRLFIPIHVFRIRTPLLPTPNIVPTNFLITILYEEGLTTDLPGTSLWFGSLIF
ncbi:hypothetical protein ACJX0J_023062, partial [Zea mays]